MGLLLFKLISGGILLRKPLARVRPRRWAGRWGKNGTEGGTVMRDVEFKKQIYILRRFWFLQLGNLGTYYKLVSSQVRMHGLVQNLVGLLSPCSINTS